MFPGQTQTLVAGMQLMNGKYEIISVLGQGGFGVTYLATFKLLESKVAVKEFFMGGCVRLNDTSVSLQSLKPESFIKYKERFMDEARMLVKCAHPNVPGVKDIFEENGTAYFVMDFIDGETIESIVEREGKMAENEAVRIITQLGGALQNVHKQGFLHRDIKPANIIVDKAGTAFLLDFGAAREFIAGQTVQHSIIITHGYAPFEQYSEKRKRDTYSDIYSLGATLYYMLTGQKPSPAVDRFAEKMPEPIALNPLIHKSVNEAIMKAMEMEVQDRFQKVQDFIDKLQPEKSLNNSFGQVNTVQSFKQPIIPGPDRRLQDYVTVDKKPVLRDVNEPPILNNGSSSPNKRRAILYVSISIITLIVVVALIAGIFHKPKNIMVTNNTLLSDSTQLSVNTSAANVPKRDYLFDDFSDNHNRWYLGNGTVAMKMQHGKFIFQGLSSSASDGSLFDFGGSANDDFAVKTTVRWVQGEPQDGFGIFFSGDQSNKNHYNFVINANGSYLCTYMVNGTDWTDLVRWTPSGLINKNNASNTLKIIRSGGYIFLYVNNSLLNKLPFKGAFGTKFGLTLWGKQTVEFDDFLFKRGASTGK
jgi:serine/threonine protein kinase